MTYLLEVGSGVGNAIIPLIEMNPNLHVHAIDFAESAISILQHHSLKHLKLIALKHLYVVSLMIYYQYYLTPWI